MSLFAIGDLHLHFQSELKAQGQLTAPVWKNHEERFLNNCRRMIGPEDTLLLAGFVLVIVARFVCHYITGFSIWGQWAPEGMGKYYYSLIYNGQYMLPECIFTTVGAAVLLNIPVIRKQLGIRDR